MPNDVYQLSVNVNVPRSGVISNIMHYEAPEDGAANPWETAKDIADGWAAANQAQYLAALADDCHLVAITCRRIYALGGPTYVKVTNTAGGHADSISDSAIAANCQLIVDAAPFKSGHQYFGGIPFSAIVSNVIETAFRTILLTYLTNLILPIIGTLPGLPSYQFGIWDRKTHNLQPVVGVQVANKPTSLNKRLGPYI